MPSCAWVAAPPSPEKPAVPLPATLVIVPPPEAPSAADYMSTIAATQANGKSLVQILIVTTACTSVDSRIPTSDCASARSRSLRTVVSTPQATLTDDPVGGEDSATRDRQRRR
jgi:hypothetical protein